MKRFLFVFLAPLLLIACSLEQGSQPNQASNSPDTAKRTDSLRGLRLLPKAMSLAEKLRAKQIIQSQPALFSMMSSAPSGNIRVPAEFEPMEAVLVRVANDETMDEFFGNLVKGIIQAGAVPYLVYANDTDKSEIIEYSLQPKGVSESQVKWILNGVDAFWARDYGPWTVYADGKRVHVDPRYYPTRAFDDIVSGKLATQLSDDTYKMPLYVEGGNFMTDGKGTCWTSMGVFEYNYLSPSQLADLYRKYLGCKKLYNPVSLYQEGTTHLDMFSKLLNDELIIVGESKSAWGATANEIKSLEDAAKFYASNTNVDGRPFKVVRIPMYFKDTSDGRVYYAHTNSTIVNKTVLVPLYGLPSDEPALQVYRDNMPGYTVVGIKNSQDIIPWGGSVHCTTMQIPAKTTTNPDGKANMVSDLQKGTLTQDEWKIFGPYSAAAGDIRAVVEGSGDVDLYVWKDLAKDKITSGNFACSPYEEGSFEQCRVAGPGSFFVGLHSAAASSDFRLTVEYNKVP
ncbi:MAG: agmatine deiminase family protein [Myxococcales bacterium]|nr:agmatine deiminase family protein [Myxococcales bacterium]